MKKAIAFVVFFIVVIFPVLCQPENDTILPLITKERVWSVGYFGWRSNQPSIGDWSEKISVRGDTLINGKKWWLLKLEAGWKEDSLTTMNWGGLYEENNKVYINDMVYYDFRMQPGDSLAFCCSDVLYLDSIRKIPVFNGDIRRHYYLSYFRNQKYQNQEIWIEGIGSTNGLFTPFVPSDSGGGSEVLLCVKDNDSKTYQTPFYDVCFVPTYPFANFLYPKNKRWNYAKTDTLTGISTTLFYTLDSDTTINKSRYSKLYCSFQDGYRSEDFIGGIRQNGTNIFFLPKGEVKESVLYNFRLHPGKHVVPYFGHSDTLVVDSFSVKRFGKSDRIFWYLSSLHNPTSSPIVWVDGVGSLNDLIDNTHAHKNGDSPSVLLCYSENGVQLYQNPAFDNCSLGTGIRQNPSMPEKLIILFLTNEGQINIQSLFGAKGAFFLLGFDGCQLARKKLNGYEIVEIIPPGKGLYLYRFESSDGRIQTGKVVVK